MNKLYPFWYFRKPKIIKIPAPPVCIGYECLCPYTPSEDPDYPEQSLMYTHIKRNERDTLKLQNLQQIMYNEHDALYDLYSGVYAIKKLKDRVIIVSPPYILDGNGNILLGDYEENMYICGVFNDDKLYTVKFNPTTSSLYIDIYDADLNLINEIDITEIFLFFIVGVYDVDNDDEVEIILIGEEDLAILKEDGTLLMYYSTTYRLPVLPAIYDFDNDGITEIAIFGSSRLEIIKYDGTVVASTILSEEIIDYTIGDFNNDGKPEIAIVRVPTRYTGEKAYPIDIYFFSIDDLCYASIGLSIDAPADFDGSHIHIYEIGDRLYLTYPMFAGDNLYSNDGIGLVVIDPSIPQIENTYQYEFDPRTFAPTGFTALFTRTLRYNNIYIIPLLTYSKELDPRNPDLTDTALQLILSTTSWVQIEDIFPLNIPMTIDDYTLNKIPYVLVFVHDYDCDGKTEIIISIQASYYKQEDKKEERKYMAYIYILKPQS